MVQRASEAFQINTGSGVGVQQSSMGQARPDVNKFASSNVIQQAGAPKSSYLLDTILGVGQKLATQAFQRSTEEKYLEGAAAAGRGDIEADLRSDPLMADWQTAGFRDTMSRLSQADENSKTAAEMATLREQSPEMFEEYLAQRRLKLLPQMEGMSFEARKGMLASMVMDERAAIKLHGAEHYKFGVETQLKSVTVKAEAATAALNSSRIMSPGANPTAAYDAAGEAAIATIMESTLGNHRLPRSALPGAIKGVAQQFLQNNHLAVYEKMRDMTFQNDDGTSSSLLGALDPDDRAQLAGMYREAQGRVVGYKAFGFQMDSEAMEQGWKNPDIPLQPFAQVDAYITQGWNEGMFGEPGSLGATEKAAAMRGRYIAAAMDRDKSSGLGAAFATGNIAQLHALNATPGDAMSAWFKSTGSKMPMPDALRALVTINRSSGWSEPLAKAAEMTAPAISQLMTENEIDPAHATMMSNLFKQIDSDEGGMQLNSMYAYVGAFKDKETQDFILMTRQNMKNGFGATNAIAKARTDLLEFKKNPGLAQARTAQANKDDAAALANMQPSGMFAQGTSFLKGMLGMGDGMVVSGFWNNKELVADANAIIVHSTASELAEVRRERPNLDSESAFDLAKARVKSRTVTTQWGPVVAPQGQTLESFFGIKDPERLTLAMQRSLKATTDGGRLIFSTDAADGSLMVQEKRKDGTFMGVKRMNAKEFGKVAGEMRTEEATKYNMLKGAGTTAPIKVDGKDFPITYNGVNALGVREDWMHEFRGRLIKHEGVTAKPYKDSGGQINKKTGLPVQTVGVGISDTNTFYPQSTAGGITPKQASDSLRNASEEASRAAVRWTATARLSNNKEAFQLLSEMAYQGGGGNGGTLAVVEAMRNREPAKAMQALRASKPYRAAHSERRKFYEATLQAALKE